MVTHKPNSSNMLDFVTTSPVFTQDVKLNNNNDNIIPTHSSKPENNINNQNVIEQENKKPLARFPIVPRTVNSSQQVIKGMRQALLESAF